MRSLKILLALAAFVGATVPTPVDAAELPIPSLRLVRSQEHVYLQRFEAFMQIDLGVYVASVGGEARFVVERDGWSGSVSATLGGFELPADLVGFDGLRDFAQMTFSQNGDIVARQTVTFCPNGWDQQRMDGTGPLQPTFPETCPATSFPFTRAMVIGIDQGWAASLTAPASEVPGQLLLDPGRYDVRVKVMPTWARTLRIPVEHRTVQLRATVVEIDEPGPHADTKAGARPTQLAASFVPPVLPDLAALPAWRISTEHEDDIDLLSFASTPWNAGPGPFVVEGFRRGNQPVMDAHQYLYDAAGQPVERSPIGELAFHAGGGHDHWHFLQFAAFDLLAPDRKTVVRSQKQGFCMAATDPVDLSLPGASMRPSNSNLHSACGGPRALWIREVLPSGWGDTYFNVSGQAFDITTVPNGRYLIRVRVDPERVLEQVTRDNDEAIREVRLGGRPGARTVRVADWNGITDVAEPVVPVPPPMDALTRQSPTRGTAF